LPEPTAATARNSTGASSAGSAVVPTMVDAGAPRGKQSSRVAKKRSNPAPELTVSRGGAWNDRIPATSSMLAPDAASVFFGRPDIARRRASQSSSRPAGMPDAQAVSPKRTPARGRNATVPVPDRNDHRRSRLAAGAARGPCLRVPVRSFR